MIEKRIDIKFIITTAIVVILTWILHEFTHWSTSELFGYETIMQLNSTYTNTDVNPTEVQNVIISITGPAITILQAAIAFFLLKIKWNKSIYTILFTAFYMRFLAGLMNFVQPNDEGRVSNYLGVGTYTLSIIVSIFLFVLLYKISKKYLLDWKYQFKITLIVMFFTSLLILSDQYFNIRIL